MLDNVGALQSAARKVGVPVLHFSYVVDTSAGLPARFHPVDADGRSAFSDVADANAAIVASVAPREGESHRIKSAASCFSLAGLEDDLRVRDIEWLVVCGVWTEACIDATVRDAVARGFRVLLVKDACGSATAAMHQVGILNLANRLYGGAVTDTGGAAKLIAGARVDVWKVEGSVPIRFGFDDAASMYAAL